MNDTHVKPSKPLGPSPSNSNPEGFGPPSITNLASLTDGRPPGDFASRYSGTAWLQICGELFYLLATLAGSVYGLVLIALVTVLAPLDSPLPDFMGKSPENMPLLVWTAAALSGACGGAAASLKWLYHSVAKQQWHRDRLVWRIIVPPLSSILSVFTGLMIISGLIPFFSKTPFTNPAVGAAFGFFVGFFSDNLLASLQKFAFRIFGTIDKSGD